MTVHKTIELSDEAAAFLERVVADGRFGNAADAVEEALQLLAEQDEAVRRLREAIAEGEASGEPQPFDVEDFLERARMLDQ